MIKIKFVGGAKKSFGTDTLELDLDGITVEQLLCEILNIKPNNTIDFDIGNILVAINGVDSSALGGRKTILKNNDVVTIIPVIHGGADYFDFKCKSRNVRLYEIKGTKINGIELLDKLRVKYKKLKIQAISKNFILNYNHLQKIIELSLENESLDLLLSKKLETDILMRFAIEEQISEAIKKAGIQHPNNFFLIVLGNVHHIKKLHNELEELRTGISFVSPSKIKQQFNITKHHIKSVYTKTPLEDILLEKAAVLFRNTSF
ncbi:MAG: KEOPS complex subunit Cgi121 [Nitrosopumilaceae archaeon]|nr:KEOPS complex subunit Cgi121 [Nitrosopumilaceae archaeon]